MRTIRGVRVDVMVRPVNQSMRVAVVTLPDGQRGTVCSGPGAPLWRAIRRLLKVRVDG